MTPSATITDTTVTPSAMAEEHNHSEQNHSPAAASASSVAAATVTHGTPAMQKEHEQLEALVPDSAATAVAKQSGSWFNPSTWVGGKIPGDKAKVLIGKGVSVSYDSKSDVRLFTLNVEGQLKFATDKNTKMVVDTFVVSPEGKLEIGTAANPVKASVKTEILIADNGPLDLKWDPGQLSRGLISHGTVQIHGQAKTSHLKLATDPRAGDRTLTLQAAPKNWQVGDRLVLTGTKFVSDTNGQKWDTQTQDEEVVIQSIKGNRLTLDRALKFGHETPRGDLKAYVANQSRNIVIASENADRLPPAQRGHTMFMHSDNVDIRYVEFKDLGRTDKTKPIDNFKTTGGVFPTRVLDAKGNPVEGARQNISGRYAAHIHRVGTDGKPAVMVGNVVDGSPGWGFVVHDSAAILEENVAYDVDGGAFVTESGNEIGAMRNNISIKTGPGIDNIIEKQGTGTHDFARTGVGFWFQGRSVENEGNVAAGSRGAGMFYFHRGVDLAPSKISDLPVPGLAKDLLPGGETVNTDQVPIQNFKNNEVFASGTGIHVIKDFPKQTNDLRTVMNGFKGWEVERGGEFQYTSHYTLNNFDLISSKDAKFWQNQGLELQKNTQEFVFNNMKVSGFTDGISVQADTGEGPPALKDRGLVWIDLKLENNKNNLKGITIPPEKWLKSSSLTPGRLDFKVASDSDFVVSGSDVGDYVTIRGTKTDSLGTIQMPFGDEKISFNYQGVERLAKKGYYTLPDGSRAALIEEYFSDRVTGEVKKYPFVVTFKENWWTDGAPYLGKLDPKSLAAPTKVTLPGSRFQLSRSPIQSVPMPMPASPTIPGEEETPVTGLPTVPGEGETPPTSGLPTVPGEGETPPTSGLPTTPGEGEPPSGLPTTPGTGETPPSGLPTQPTNSQPVVAYDFDEAIRGLAKDTSVGGEENMGELWYGVARSEGLSGSSVVMDGTGSVRLESSAELNLDDHPQRSVSLWFKANELSEESDKQVLFEEGDSSRGLNAYLDDDVLYVGTWDGSGPGSSGSGSGENGQQGTWVSTELSGEGVPAGKWNHVALVLDGADTLKPDALKVYLNGEEMGSGEASQLLGHDGAVTLGNIAGTTRFHDGVGSGFQGLVGALDEVQIFNQALSGDQVKTLASASALG